MRDVVQESHPALILPIEKGFQRLIFFAQDGAGKDRPRIGVMFLRIKQGNRIFAGLVFGVLLQGGRFFSSHADGIFRIVHPNACADGQCAGCISMESIRNPRCRGDDVIPRAQQKHIVAAGINDGNLQRLLFILR